MGQKLVVLEGRGLTCVKRDRTLFENVNFSVSKSEILHVKGPNGAGKTSLLRILVGLSEADHGEILFHEDPIQENQEQFHNELVYFGHKLGLNLTLNAIDNIQFWCQQQGIHTDTNSLFKILGDLGLVGLEELPVGSLSAGQQRRVALSRLWLKQKATLWVLDEPYTALDVQGITFLQEKLLEFLSQGNSIIMTSHQQLQIPYSVKELVLEYQI